MTDRELQDLIAPALRARLREAGFKTGVPSDEHAGFFFPINLELSGSCDVARNADGTWTFSQCDALVADRTAATLMAHYNAIQEASAKFYGG